MTEDTYTHRPGEVEESEAQRASKHRAAEPRDESRGGRESGDEIPAAEDPAAPVERGNEEWNYRDWILVGVIFVCFLVIPAIILVLPPVRPFKFAYLVLPLIPAILLGATAVWSAQRSD